MEVVVRLATVRPSGGPVGTGEGGKRGRSVYRSWGHTDTCSNGRCTPAIAKRVH